jgi:hypothetical protein
MELDFKTLSFDEPTKKTLLPEPLLEITDRRFVLFPIKHNDVIPF